MNKIDIVTSKGKVTRDLDGNNFIKLLESEILLFETIDNPSYRYIFSSYNQIKEWHGHYKNNEQNEVQLKTLILNHNEKFKSMQVPYVAMKIVNALQQGTITNNLYIKIFHNVNQQLTDPLEIYLYYTLVLDYEFGNKKSEEEIEIYTEKQRLLEEQMTSNIEILSSNIEEFNNYCKEKIDEIRNEQNSNTENFDNWMKENSDKISTLESQYRKVLEFDTPAKFWEEKSKEYSNLKKKWWKGFIAMIFILIITTVLIGLILFGSGFVYETGVLTIEFIAIDKTISLGTMLFVVAIESIILYAIKVILSYVNLYVKLEEFYKAKSMLTSFYITMSDDIVKEKDVQSLIYQQLFSFSDVPINEINDRGILQAILSATTTKQ